MFGRNHPHPYDPIIRAWLARKELEYRAMARNLFHEHRVSMERAASFDALTNYPRTESDLQAAIVRYKETHIKTALTPQFLDAAVNGNNIVSGSSDVAQLIHKDEPLVRVLDLNGLMPVFQWAKRRQALLASFPTRPNAHAVDRWLTKMIRQLSHEQFARACLNAINDYRHHRLPFHPTWAASWRRFKPYAGQGGDCWLQVMGMNRDLGPRWLMLLVYKVGEAGTVARPTQLDAGWGPHHFPSPPQAKVASGGHPMDLETSRPHTELLSEFIHQQIDHTLKHWTDAGGRIERTSGPTGGSLDSQRTHHHQRLILHYGQRIFYWMPKPI